MAPSARTLEDAYGPDVARMMAERAVAAAEVVVPMVLEHVRPRSVIDFGCGSAHWAAEFRRRGAEEVLGVDGPWVARDELAIAADELVVHDVTEPFEPPHEFDLAVCLEVAQHVPPEREDVFVDSLARCAPVVLFSAPVPDQPGVGATLNNRWPAHWAEAFSRRGMSWVDCLRLRVWAHPRVTWWYAQNMALVVRDDLLAGLPGLKATAEPLALIHPGMVRHLVAPRPPAGVRARLARRIAG